MIHKFLPLAAVCVAGSALAGTPINQTRAVAPDARIEISNVKGTVTVSAWDKPEVAISGTLGEGSRGLTVEGEGPHLRVKVEGPDKSKGFLHWGSDASMEESELELKVPRQASLDVNVVSAEVDVSGVSGKEVQIESVSGRVRLDSGSPRIAVNAVSGDVEITGKADDARIETVSGDIHARGLSGRIHTETVSGGIHVDASHALKDADASTVSGDIEIRGQLASAGRVRIESMSGDVRLRFPADLSARLEAQSFSGTIRTDFGSVEKREHGPGSHLSAAVGKSDGDVSIDTFSGDVSIQRD